MLNFLYQVALTLFCFHKPYYQLCDLHKPLNKPQPQPTSNILNAQLNSPFAIDTKFYISQPQQQQFFGSSTWLFRSCNRSSDYQCNRWAFGNNLQLFYITYVLERIVLCSNEATL